MYSSTFRQLVRTPQKNSAPHYKEQFKEAVRADVSAAGKRGVRSVTDETQCRGCLSDVSNKHVASSLMTQGP